ncbi:MAG: PAS domain S-box protein [Caldilineaceae bacterium]|nr:PAS domain S-box protein [Caldilineaceae bacterium]
MSQQNEGKPATTSLHAEVAALRAENAQLREQLRILERLVPDPVIELDRELRVKNFSRLVDGFSADSVKFRWLELVELPDRAKIVEMFGQVFAEHRAASVTVGARREDNGQPMRFTVHAVPGDDSEDPQSIVVLARDATEEHKLLGQLATQRAYFQAIFEQATDMILLFDDDMRCIEANPALAATLGYSAEELGSLSLPDLFPHMALADGPERWQAFLAKGSLRGTAQMRRKDSTLFDTEFRAVANIMPGVHMSITRDISAQQQAEREVAQRRAFYRAIFESVPFGLGTADRDGRPVAWNQAMLRTTGYSEAELQATQRVSDFFVDAERVRRIVTDNIEFQGRELEMRRPDGTTFPARVSLALVPLPDGAQTLAIVEDVSAEAKMRADLEFQARVLATMHEAVVVVDKDRRVEYLNDRARTLFCVVPGDIMGQGAYGQLRWRVAEPAGAGEAPADVAPGGNWSAQLVVDLPDGTERRMGVTATRRRDRSGNDNGWIAVLHDVTAEHHLADALATQSAHLEAIFEHAADMILLTGDDMRYIDVNPAAAATLGYTVEEMRALAVTDVFPPMEQATALALWQAFIAEGSQAGEVQVRRKDGTVIDVGYRAVANILPGVHLSIMRDIGERKQLEADLARSEAYYRAIFEHAPIGMGISDPSGKPVAWNAAMAQASGVSDADVRALDHAADLYATPEERERLLDLLVAQGSVQRAAVRMRRADGSSYPVRMSLQPIELSGGRHLLAMMEDVTEEVDARAQEAFLASVMSNLQDAVTVTDSAGRVIFWNAGAEALSGVSAGQILGRRYRDFFGFRESSPDPVPEIRRALEATGHWEGEIPLVLLNGSELWTWTAISQLHGKDGAITGRIAVIYDLTEQRALEAANRRQAQILNGVMEAIIVTDLAFNITDWNANADAMYGWRAGEVVGRSVDALLGTEHEDLDAVLAEFRDKGRWQGEVSQRHKDGQSLCVLASVSYVYDDGGAPVAVVAVNRDITRRHDAENALRTAQSDLRRLMRRLERTEMTQRKELARNLHDDLGATLTAVRLDIDWLDAHLHDSAPPDVIAKLERMAGLATAAIRTTQAVTSDLRPSLLDDLGLVAALEYLAETWSTAAAIPADLHLDEALEERLDPELAMDLYRIAQEALTNVARHAAATQATLELTEEDGQVVLLVADNGRGVEIDRQIAAEALGLIGMRERAEAWDGSMVLTGVPGRGSILTVRIPLDAATMAGGGSDPGPDDAPGKP